MSVPQSFEEEEFTTKFNGQTLLRVLKQTRPHWRLVAGFLFFITLVAVTDSATTFLNKLIIDDAIVPGDRQMLTRLLAMYGGLFLISAVSVFGSATTVPSHAL